MVQLHKLQFGGLLVVIRICLLLVFCTAARDSNTTRNPGAGKLAEDPIHEDCTAYYIQQGGNGTSIDPSHPLDDGHMWLGEPLQWRGINALECVVYNRANSPGLGAYDGHEVREVQKLLDVISKSDIGGQLFSGDTRIVRVDFLPSYIARTKSRDVYALRGTLTVDAKQVRELDFWHHGEIEFVEEVQGVLDMRERRFNAEHCLYTQWYNGSGYITGIQPCRVVPRFHFQFPSSPTVQNLIGRGELDILLKNPEAIAINGGSTLTLKFMARNGFTDNTYKFTRIEEAKALRNRTSEDVGSHLRVDEFYSAKLSKRMLEVLENNIRMHVVWQSRNRSLVNPSTNEDHPFTGKKLTSVTLFNTGLPRDRPFSQVGFWHRLGKMCYKQTALGELSLCFGLKFFNASDAAAAVPYNGSDSEQWLLAEGIWDWKAKQLVMVGCHIGINFRNAGEILDCQIQITFQFSGLRTIHHPYELVGHVKSLRAIHDPLFFPTFSLVGPSKWDWDDSLQGSSFYYFVIRCCRNYYTASALALGRIKPFCTSSAAGTKWAKYPTKADLPDIMLSAGMLPLPLNEIKPKNSTLEWLIKAEGPMYISAISSGTQSAESVHVAAKRSKVDTEIEGMYRYQANGTFAAFVNYHIKVVPVPVPGFHIDEHRFFANNSSSGDPWFRDMSAEGWYYPKTGQACMVLCRIRTGALAAGYERSEADESYSSLDEDCENLLQIQYAQTNPILWTSPPHVRASIKSLRNPSDPLFYERIDLESRTLVNKIQLLRGKSRQDLMTAISLIAFLCIILLAALRRRWSSRGRLQSLYLGALPYLSFSILFILTLAHAVFIALDIDSISPAFLRKQGLEFPNGTEALRPEVNQLLAFCASVLAFTIELWWLFQMWNVRADREVALRIHSSGRIGKRLTFYILPLYTVVCICNALGFSQRYVFGNNLVGLNPWSIRSDYEAFSGREFGFFRNISSAPSTFCYVFLLPRVVYCALRDPRSPRHGTLFTGLLCSYIAVTLLRIVLQAYNASHIMGAYTPRQVFQRWNGV